jgi:hypothetical protein
LTENLEVAYSQGRLNEFFNAAHNTSSYMDLVQLMADSAVRLLSDCFPLFDFRQLVMADDFLKSIRGVEVSHGCRTDFSLVFSSYNRTRNRVTHLPEVCNYGFFSFFNRSS